MEKKKDLAIILRTVPYQERHRIITALTENHGKISAIAKNSIHSRRFGASLEAFTASEWHFTERQGTELYHLDEVSHRRSFENIRKDFERLSLASLFNELMLRSAPERAPCEDLFRLHANALALLDEAPGSGIYTAWMNSYLGKLLLLSGSQPQLENCFHCQTTLDELTHKPEPQFLFGLIVESGWICQRCRRTLQTTTSPSRIQELPIQAVKDWVTLLEIPIRQCVDAVRATEEEHRTLFLFLEALLIYHLPGFGERGFKSLRFLGLKSNLPPEKATPPQNQIAPA